MAETVNGVNTATTEAVDGVEIKVPCEVYSRIVGYLRPIQNWNAGKQQEFADRKMFRVRNDLYTPMTLTSENVPFSDLDRRKKAIAYNNGGH